MIAHLKTIGVILVIAGLAGITSLYPEQISLALIAVAIIAAGVVFYGCILECFKWRTP